MAQNKIYDICLKALERMTIYIKQVGENYDASSAVRLELGGSLVGIGAVEPGKTVRERDSTLLKKSSVSE